MDAQARGAALDEAQRMAHAGDRSRGSFGRGARRWRLLRLLWLGCALVACRGLELDLVDHNCHNVLTSV
jgi:hypothetical protein